MLFNQTVLAMKQHFQANLVYEYQKEMKEPRVSGHIKEPIFIRLFLFSLF